MSRGLVEIADELYALAPEEFTAARDTAARAARDEGERDLAAAVKQFRRPSVGAWLVNRIARTEELEELLDLGVALREAQDALDGAELLAMSRQRHQVIRGLSTLAREVSGKKVADTAQREFEATLDAALADDAAARAVRTGRLMRALTSTGLEPVDLTNAVAAPEADPPARRPVRRTGPPEARTRKRTQDKAAADKKKQQAAVAAAERALADAQRDLDAHEQHAGDAAAAAAAARARTADAEAELDAARTAQAEADRGRRDAAGAVKSATRARDAAQRALDTARKRAGRE